MVTLKNFFSFKITVFLAQYHCNDYRHCSCRIWNSLGT